MSVTAPQANPRDRRIAGLKAENASCEDEGMRAAWRREVGGRPDFVSMHAWLPATSTRVSRLADCRTLSDPILSGKFVGDDSLWSADRA